MGTQAAMTNEDDWITTYRCHGAALMRGCSVQSIFEEMFGFEGGAAHGKGMYIGGICEWWILL